jgi:hypothetical protein
MIEAMARALPCVGSMVGGIPELISAEDLVPPNDAHALARKIREVIADPARMARMSVCNLEKAREYGETLDQGRHTFYSYVRTQTDAWLQANGACLRRLSAKANGTKLLATDRSDESSTRIHLRLCVVSTVT